MYMEDNIFSKQFLQWLREQNHSVLEGKHSGLGGCWWENIIASFQLFPLILVELSLMSVLGDLAGKFDSDSLLVSKDTDKDVNNESTLYRDQDIPLDFKDTNNMEAMLLSDDGFIRGKYMDSTFNIFNYQEHMINNNHKIELYLKLYFEQYRLAKLTSCLKLLPHLPSQWIHKRF